MFRKAEFITVLYITRNAAPYPEFVPSYQPYTEFVPSYPPYPEFVPSDMFSSCVADLQILGTDLYEEKT